MQATNIPKEINITLSKLCFELAKFLKQTETDVLCVQKRFQQIKYVLEPWDILEISEKQEKCICDTLKTLQVSESEEVLLKDVSEILNTAKYIRNKSVTRKKDSIQAKLNVKELQTSSESKIKNKSKLFVTKSAEAGLSKHSPCCSHFKSNKESKKHLTLSEALDFYKIPTILTQTIRQSKKTLCNYKNQTKSKNSAKDIFLKQLEAQNKKYYSLCKENCYIVEPFFEYLSILNTSKKIDNDLSLTLWSVKHLEQIQNLNNNIIKKKSWGVILDLLLKEFICAVQDCNLNQEQLLFLRRIIETISNYVQCKTSTVPIFRVEIKQ